MKKTLLFSVALASMTFMANAQNSEFEVYTPSVAGEVATMGDVMGVSADGKKAVIFDEETNQSYLWELETPYVLTPIVTDTYSVSVKAFDVTNDGTIIASWLPKSSYAEMPYIYRNGEWDPLPYPAADVSNVNYPRYISEDGKYICGIAISKSNKAEGSEDGDAASGGYRVIKWTLGEDGEYDYVFYSALPKIVNTNQGFSTIGSMSEDGSVIVGGIQTFNMCYYIPGLLYNGEYKWLGEIKTKEFYYCYYEPLQKYTTDIIENYNGLWMIDSGAEGSVLSNCVGMLNYYDSTTGKAYGTMSVGVGTPKYPFDEMGREDYVSGMNLNEGLRCKNYGIIYDPATGELTEDEKHSNYAMAYDNLIFLAGKNMLVDGEDTKVSDYYGVEISQNVNVFNQRSNDCETIGGSYAVVNPATGEPQMFPILIAPKHVDGVDAIAADTNVEISVANGVVSVKGGVASVYTLDGKMVGAGENVGLTSGLYVVKAGNKVQKVFVK